MLKMLCAHCGNSFLPRPQTPDQSYCSDPQCQKARRKRWVDEKRKSDFIFRDNQSRTQKAWMERNPDFYLTSTILTARRQLFWPVEAGNELNSLFT